MIPTGADALPPEEPAASALPLVCMPIPPKPLPPAEPKKSSWLPALVVLSLLSIGLTGVSLITASYFGIVLLIGSGAFCLATFHYLLWGWWLGDVVRRWDHDANDDD